MDAALGHHSLAESQIQKKLLNALFFMLIGLEMLIMPLIAALFIAGLCWLS